MKTVSAKTISLSFRLKREIQIIFDQAAHEEGGCVPDGIEEYLGDMLGGAAKTEWNAAVQEHGWDAMMEFARGMK